jgi:hypothetical protein
MVVVGLLQASPAVPHRVVPAEPSPVFLAGQVEEPEILVAHPAWRQPPESAA